MALDKALQSIKRQANEAPWLKWAGLLILVLLAAFVLQSLDALRVAQQKHGIEAELNLKRILSLKGQDVWLSREKAAQQMRASLDAQLPKVATAGMAQASLQSWLQKITSGFDAQQKASLRITRAAPLEDMPDILQVNASLNGNFGPRQMLSLLRQIESAPNLVVVETLRFQNDSSNSTLHLTVNAYYRLQAGKAAP